MTAFLTILLSLLIVSSVSGGNSCQEEGEACSKTVFQRCCGLPASVPDLTPLLLDCNKPCLVAFWKILIVDDGGGYGVADFERL
nr:unnamed protein product [Spirometra erinaceieuropaei]